MGFTAIPVSSVHNIIVSPSHRFFSFDSRFPMMHHFNATAGTGRIQRCTTKISAARLIPMYIGNRRHHPQTIGFCDGKTIPTLSSCCSRIVVSSALMSNEESGDIIHTINKNNNITTNNNYSKELDIAVSAVQLACSLCQRLQEDFVLATNTCHNQIESKGDLSPVTVADWSVQATVSWVLSEHFGNENVSLIAEEDVLTLRRPDSAGLLQSVVSTVNNCLVEASKYGLTGPKKTLNSNEILEAISRCNSLGGPRGRYWVLDPVDGTLGFVRGDQYAVALALIEDGKIILGVLGCPNYPMKRAWLDYHQRYYRIMSKWSPPSFGLWHKGCVMYAKKGSGEAWMQPLVHDRAKLELPIFVKPIQVSTVDDPGMAIFCEPVEKANSSHSFTAGLAQSVGLRKQPLRVYSMVKYAAIARGDAEIFMKFARAGYKEKIWDHAAGVVIIEEAGGVVTDARGSPLDFSKGIYLESLDRGIIACSGASLHEKIIRAVDASWDSSGL